MKLNPTASFSGLCNKKVLLKANVLGISKTKTVRYLMGIDPRTVSQISTKEKLQETLDTVILNPDKLLKLDPSLNDMINIMRESRDDVTIDCPPFEIFKTSIRTGPSNDQLSTNVLGIKCNTRKKSCSYL